MNRMKPLRLSGVMTFALACIAIVAVNLWWKERSKLIREVQWLQEQIVHPEKYLSI